MHQQFSISPEEAKRAKWPHEIFLINLIFNHVLLFASTFGVYRTFPLLVLVVPVISFTIVSYIFIKAGQIAKSDETWFVKAHWQICAKRNRIFTMLLVAACVISGGILLLSNALHWNQIATIAMISGLGMLPFILSILVLIILGNESVFLARTGKLSKRFVEQHPHPETYAPPAQ